MAETSYSDDFARLYDLFHEAKDYGAEVGFLAEHLQEAGIGPGAGVLDLACGTGGHALELAARGYEVLGIDLSAPMLQRAAAKAEERRLRVDLLRQDMRELDVGTRKVDAAICLFDSLGYLLDDEAIGRALARISRVLEPDGLLVLEVWHGAAMLRKFEPVRVRRLRKDGLEIVRISETSLDEASQVATVQYTVFEELKGGRYQRFQELHRNRFFFRAELGRLLAEAGLEASGWFDGLSPKGADIETWHLVATSRKRRAPRAPAESAGI